MPIVPFSFIKKIIEIGLKWLKFVKKSILIYNVYKE